MLKGGTSVHTGKVGEGREVGLEKWVVGFIWLEMRMGEECSPKVGIMVMWPHLGFVCGHEMKYIGMEHVTGCGLGCLAEELAQD